MGILICRLNGTGKSTLGRTFSSPRSREEVIRLLEERIVENKRFIFAAARSNYEGEPCYTVCLCLDDKEDDDVLPNGVVYTEKEGNYWVLVNVKTGVIEEVSYSAGIGGNG